MVDQSRMIVVVVVVVVGHAREKEIKEDWYGENWQWECQKKWREAWQEWSGAKNNKRAQDCSLTVWLNNEKGFESSTTQWSVAEIVRRQSVGFSLLGIMDCRNSQPRPSCSFSSSSFISSSRIRTQLTTTTEEDVVGRDRKTNTIPSPPTSWEPRSISTSR